MSKECDVIRIHGNIKYSTMLENSFIMKQPEYAAKMKKLGFFSYPTPHVLLPLEAAFVFGLFPLSLTHSQHPVLPSKFTPTYLPTYLPTDME